MSTKGDSDRIELLQGTLDLLILRTLQPGPAHGHSIARAIEVNSDEVLQIEQGSLYPALHRLIKRGWISAEDGTSENNRRAKFYKLTARGRKQLARGDGQVGQACGRHRSHSPSQRAGGPIMRRKRMLEDLDRDIRDHIATQTEDNIARGMAPAEAHHAAST